MNKHRERAEFGLNRHTFADNFPLSYVSGVQRVLGQPERLGVVYKFHKALEVACPVSTVGIAAVWGSCLSLHSRAIQSYALLDLLFCLQNFFLFFHFNVVVVDKVFRM